jgi:hypothetical protein
MGVCETLEMPFPNIALLSQQAVLGERHLKGETTKALDLLSMAYVG